MGGLVSHQPLELESYNFVFCTVLLTENDKYSENNPFKKEECNVHIV